MGALELIKLEHPDEVALADNQQTRPVDTQRDIEREPVKQRKPGKLQPAARVNREEFSPAPDGEKHDAGWVEPELERTPRQTGNSPFELVRLGVPEPDLAVIAPG
jgi:hypothetical protein